jgi:hypothetical protein
MLDEREQVALTEEEIALKIAARKKAEADAEEADERARIQTIGGAAFGVLGLLVAGVALLIQENVMIGMIGSVIGFVGFGVITAAQGAKWLGRDK